MSELLTDKELAFFLAGPPMRTDQERAEVEQLGIRAAEELRRWRSALVWLSEQDQGVVFKNVHGLFCASVGECETYRVALEKTFLEAIEALRENVEG